MRLQLLTSFSLLLLSLQSACAQSADDFFHGGAQFYLSNNIASAKEEVDTGLKFYPGDTKLKKLDELLKQQSQQQSQKNQQSQQNSEQNQKQQQQQFGQNQSQQQSQQNQPAQNQSGQQNDKQQEQQQQEKSAGKQSDEKRDGQIGQSQALKAQEMSPEEAQRLLDAQKGDEQFLQLKPKNPPESPNKPIKDW